MFRSMAYAMFWWQGSFRRIAAGEHCQTTRSRPGACLNLAVMKRHGVQGGG